MYNSEKNITRLNNIGYTYFLDPRELNEVKSKLKKNKYNIYKPYPNSIKNIIYKRDIPEVYLYRIKSKIELRHQDILGCMYSLDISNDLYGDIVLDNNNYYIYILPIIRNYFESNFIMVRNSYIELEEVNLDILNNYYRSYKIEEYIVSSCRIDTIISSICHCNRKKIISMIAKKEILLNYDYLKKSDINLVKDDVFSIKRIGKYKFNGIIKSTKKNHYIIQVYKYL